ncbi:NTP transferase domain-containing protein [bacterium]|jgi:spore coat polysaccharide biosynthesis protein SpsF (cytidylyltransferase family)|nr:NTP transferase domain-containing protein [bacterium]
MEKAMPTATTATTTAIAVIDLGDVSTTGSSQLAARFTARKLGGQTLINRMARRLSECQLVERVYVVGAGLPATILTSGFADIDCIDLPASHVCERLCEAADASNAEWVVYVPANRPFIDPTLIDQMLAKAGRTNSCDYVGYRTGNGDPVAMDKLGLTGEACHADTLRRLRRNVDRLVDQQVGSLAAWLMTAPGAYHLKFIPVPEKLNRDDLRFSIESEEDWDDAEVLCETMPEADSQWQELAQLVLANPCLRDSMADRNA